MLANYLPKTAEQLHLEHQKRQAAIWARYPKIKRAFDARIAWRQSPAGIEFCASRMAKLLATEAGKPVSEMLPVARQRIRAGFAKLKQSSGGLAATGGSSNTQVGPNIGSPSATAAALSLSPQVARPPVATPAVAARPAVAAKPVVTAPTDRQYNDVQARWMAHQYVKYSGGSKYRAAIDELIRCVKASGRTAAFQKMTADLSTK